MKRYADATDRARLLYRFPPAPGSRRTLELFRNGTPLFRESDWPEAEKTFCRIGQGTHDEEPQKSKRDGNHLIHLDFRTPLPFANQSFDLVILHRVIDDLASLRTSERPELDASLLLKTVSTVLAPGGIVAGCVNNRWGAKQLASWLRRMVHPSQKGPPLALFTLRGLHNTLSDAGYADTRLFTLLPNCSAPSKLIDTHPRVSRDAFRHELRITQHASLTSGYLLRRAVVELGLNRHLEDSIFFWASKPC
jgi:SAM-dependent methyltransferase